MTGAAVGASINPSASNKPRSSMDATSRPTSTSDRISSPAGAAQALAGTPELLPLPVANAIGPVIARGLA